MPHFDADQWSVLPMTVIFGAARLVVAAFAARALMSQLGQKRATGPSKRGKPTPIHQKTETMTFNYFCFAG
jgi:hypothetical protein